MDKYAAALPVLVVLIWFLIYFLMERSIWSRQAHKNQLAYEEQKREEKPEITFITDTKPSQSEVMQLRRALAYVEGECEGLRINVEHYQQRWSEANQEVERLRRILREKFLWK